MLALRDTLALVGLFYCVMPVQRPTKLGLVSASCRDNRSPSTLNTADESTSRRKDLEIAKRERKREEIEETRSTHNLRQSLPRTRKLAQSPQCSSTADPEGDFRVGNFWR
jgi:hypothetical protein